MLKRYEQKVCLRTFVGREVLGDKPVFGFVEDGLCVVLLEVLATEWADTISHNLLHGCSLVVQPGMCQVYMFGAHGIMSVLG